MTDQPWTPKVGDRVRAKDASMTVDEVLPSGVRVIAGGKPWRIDDLEPADEPSVDEMLAVLVEKGGEVTIAKTRDGLYYVPWAHWGDYVGPTPTAAIRAAFEAVKGEG